MPQILVQQPLEAVHWSRFGAANARGYLRCMNLPGH
jgi:hypothetical protein